MPLSLWVEAFLTVVYLISRPPSLVLQNDSPYYRLFNRLPNYYCLRVFGYRCYPSLRHQNNSKFMKKTYLCVLVRYSPIHKGYHCLEPQTRKFFISRHVVFDEGNLLYVSK